MRFLISPAKTLDFDSAPMTDVHTQPQFLEESSALVEELRSLSVADIRSLMGVSENIADLNVERFQQWQQPFTSQNAKQAVLAFKGDVYVGLNVDSMTDAHLDYLQDHLFILSGLYGLLRPLDLIQPYRLEMGTKFNNKKGATLYAFWGDKLTQALNEALTGPSDVLVNLASNEYFKSVQPKNIHARIVTPVFKDLKNGAYKVVSFYAKKARGLMVRFAVDHNIRDVEKLKDFDYEGYCFNPELSGQDEWVFTRDQPPAK